MEASVREKSATLVGTGNFARDRIVSASFPLWPVVSPPGRSSPGSTPVSISRIALGPCPGAIMAIQCR